MSESPENEEEALPLSGERVKPRFFKISIRDILVVLLVLGLLLFSVVRFVSYQYKLKGWNAHCRASVQEIALAMEGYASDSDGEYPESLGQLVPSYLEEIPQCAKDGGTPYELNFYRIEAIDYKSEVLAFSIDCAKCQPGQKTSGYPSYQWAEWSERVQALKACKNNVKDLGLALESYAESHQGNYPESLSQLTPEYIEIFPECPLRGQATYQFSSPAENESGDESSRSYRVRCNEGHRYPLGESGYPQYDGVSGLIER